MSRSGTFPTLCFCHAVLRLKANIAIGMIGMICSAPWLRYTLESSVCRLAVWDLGEIPTLSGHFSFRFSLLRMDTRAMCRFHVNSRGLDVTTEYMDIWAVVWGSYQPLFSFRECLLSYRLLQLCMITFLKLVDCCSERWLWPPEMERYSNHIPVNETQRIFLFICWGGSNRKLWTW